MFHLYPSISNSIGYPEHIAIAFFNFHPPLHFPEVLSRYPQIQYVNFGKKKFMDKNGQKMYSFTQLNPKLKKKEVCFLQLLT